MDASSVIERLVFTGCLVLVFHCHGAEKLNCVLDVSNRSWVSSAMLLLFLVPLNIYMIDGRVHCQDIRATPWKAIGFSCPITCPLIISAVDRLKQIDYQSLMSVESGENIKKIKKKIKSAKRMHHDIPFYKLSHDIPDEKDSQTYEAFKKILQTAQFFSDFKSELTNLTAVFNVSCYLVANRNRLFRQVLNECSIDKPRDYIIDRFKEFLNKHADANNSFDDQMTLIILKRLLSTSNFRHGIINSIMAHMTAALEPADMRREERVTLSNKHCLSMFMPGCFCTKGYVEHNSRCVKAEDCSTDLLFKAYIYRINIV